MLNKRCNCCHHHSTFKVNIWGMNWNGLRVVNIHWWPAIAWFMRGFEPLIVVCWVCFYIGTIHRSITWKRRIRFFYSWPWKLGPLAWWLTWHLRLMICDKKPRRRVMAVTVGIAFWLCETERFIIGIIVPGFLRVVLPTVQWEGRGRVQPPKGIDINTRTIRLVSAIGRPRHH